MKGKAAVAGHGWPKEALQTSPAGASRDRGSVGARQFASPMAMILAHVADLVGRDFGQHPQILLTFNHCAVFVDRSNGDEYHV